MLDPETLRFYPVRMKKWKYLKPGDIVDVIAPSSFTSKKNIKAGKEYLESFGLIVRIPKDLVKPDFVYANNTKKTLEHMKKAFYNKESKAVWCLRGGSGGFRLMKELSKWKKPKHKKIFVGISDTTFVHMFLNQKWNWQTLHAPMLSMLGPKKTSKVEKKDLEKIIFGKTNKAVFNKLVPMNKAALKNKKIAAEMVGGNLCIVESTVGTDYKPQFKNKIVFLEDIDERGYALERSLEHLRNAGVFKNIKAVVFGDFVGGEEKDGKDFTMIALKRFAENSPFPVVRGVKSGHGELVRALPFNTHAELFLGKKATLVVDSGGEE